VIAVKRTNAVSNDTALPLNGQHLLPYFLSPLTTTSVTEFKLEDIEEPVDGMYSTLSANQPADYLAE
jgi:hypothetical protein